MHRVLTSLEEIQDEITGPKAIKYGQNYIKYFTERCEYPPNLYERMIPLQDMFQSAGLILYLINAEGNKINYCQSSFDIKHVVDIDILPQGRLEAVVAYEKKALLIENPINFAKKYSIKLNMDVLKNCIYCFPILNSKKQVLLVIELYRNDGGIFSRDDCLYLIEFGKWCGLTLEQAHRGIVENNITNTRSTIQGILSQYLATDGVNYDEFLFRILKYCIDIVQVKAVVHYDLNTSKHKLYLGRIAIVNPKMLKVIASKVLIHKESGFVFSVIKSKKALNIKIDADNLTKVNRLVRAQLGNDINNILYIPIISDDDIVGVFGLFNSLRTTKFTKADEEFGKIIAFYMYTAVQFNKICGELNVETGKIENATEILNYGLYRVLKIKDDCNPDVEIPPNFYEFIWYPTLGTEFLSLVYVMIADLCPNYFNEDSLKTFLMSIKNSIRFLAYHNFIQTVLNTHFIYLILRNAEPNTFPIEDKAALMIFSVSKYMNFIGLDNETLFLMKHPICKGVSKMYLEHNALDCAKHFIERSNLLNHLPIETSNKIIRLLSSNFIAPANVYIDLFKAKLFRNLNKPTFDINDPKFGDLKVHLIIWGSEYCRYLKVFAMCGKLTENLYMELYAIGDLQRKLRLKHHIAPEHDRNHYSELPEREYKIIEELALPMYGLLSRFFPKSEEIVKMCYCTQQGFHLLADRSRTTKRFLLEDSFTAEKEFEEVKTVNASSLFQEES